MYGRPIPRLLELRTKIEGTIFINTGLNQTDNHMLVHLGQFPNMVKRFNIGKALTISIYHIKTSNGNYNNHEYKENTKTKKC